MDNPFKRSDYAKLCMSPSLDGTLPEYVISQDKSIKEDGRYIFMKSEILYKFVYSSIRQLYCCDITGNIRVPPERATYTKIMKLLTNHIS